MNRVAVTGAAGFIGRALNERLLAGGVEVVGLDLNAEAEDVVEADITRAGSWQRELKGARTVIHTAAAVTNAAGAEFGWRANVLGTKHVLDAAVAAGAERFVHLSSVRAFSDTDFPDGVTEDHPVRPTDSVYVNTKIASEQVALQAHASGRIATTIVRPGDVYGPGSRPWTLLIVEAIKSGQFVLPANGKGVFSPAFVDNLVDGVLLAAERAEGAGEVFTISDGAGVSCEEFFGHYFRMLGKPGPRCLPTPVAVGLAALPEAYGRLTGNRTEVSRESIRYFTRTGTYSIAKARSLLGYEPAVELTEGMRRTEAWLRAEGLV